MSDFTKTRYAIVGAGPAGIAAVEAIREIDPAGKVLVINGEKVPPYCRPLIIEILRGERKLDEINLRPVEWFVERDIPVISGDPVAKIDTSGKQLVLESGKEIEYEKLLVATGSVPSTPPIDGLDKVPVFTLYQHDDIDKLKSHIKTGSRALVIGIGLIGLQAMMSLKELGVEVVAVEMMPKVLPLILDKKAASYAQTSMENHGIEIHIGTGVKELKPTDSGTRRYVATLDNGTEAGFDFAILSSGMRPNLSLLNGTGIKIDRGIIVSESMETNVPGIYAAGDVTEYSNWIEEQSEIHAHWVNAFRQGRVAGTSMAGGQAESYDPVFLNAMNVFGLPIITMGASRLDDPSDSEVYVSDAPDLPSYSRVQVKNGKLVGVTFVNNVDRAGVFQYLMREKVDIGSHGESLLSNDPDGMSFLYDHHKDAVRGDVEWPDSMYAIKWFKKDQTHTRWGKNEGK